MHACVGLSGSRGVTNGDALGNGRVVSTLCEVNTSCVEERSCLCSLCVVTVKMLIYVFFFDLQR